MPDIPAAASVWNCEATLVRLGGQELILDDLVSMFLADSPLLQQAIGQALEQRNPAEVQRNAHILKGLCSNFCATKAVAAAAEIEKLAESGVVEPPYYDLPSLARHIESLTEALLLWRCSRVPEFHYEQQRPTQSACVSPVEATLPKVEEEAEEEATARRNTERLQTVLDTTVEGIFGIDCEGLCTFCNRSAVEMLGLASDAELLNRNMHEVLHHTRADGSPYPASECRIRQTTRDKSTTHVVDEWFWRADGSSFPVEYWSRAIERNGEVKGAVVTFQDISDRLEIASRLEQLGRTVEASHDAIIVVSDDFRINSWNQGAVALFGYTREEAIGKHSWQLLQTSFRVPREEILATLASQGEWVGLLDKTTRSGKRVTVSTRFHSYLLRTGEREILEVSRDVTQDQRNQIALESARREAQRANEAKSSFLANMSHELRTPLTAVIGFADMLRMDSLTAEQLEKTDAIKRNGEYLLSLLNDILDLSRIEAGKLEIGNESVALLELVEGVRSLMGMRARDQGVPLHFDLQEHIPQTITGDRIRIRQILVNLIGNALKFTVRGEVRVSVRLSRPPRTGAPRLSSDTRIEFAVADTGIGMSSEHQKKLFQPFSQATSETAKRFGGTGLGLSISKRLAEAMQGTIAVESELGVGSCFTLSLPISSHELQNLIDPSEKLSVPKLKSSELDLPSFSARVLLADDRHDVWRVGKFFLELCGASVTIVEDGQQALDAAEEQRKAGEPFDLILMDMQMPVLSGRSTVLELRRRGYTTPIIAITANAMVGEREACLQIGCDEYVAKPIDGPKLAHLAAKLVKESMQITSR